MIGAVLVPELDQVTTLYEVVHEPPMFSAYVPARRYAVWPAVSVATALPIVRHGACSVPGLESEPLGET